MTATRTAERPSRITPEAVERVRERIGIPVATERTPHNEFVSYDSMRHYANGYGDDNPLWCDRAYGAATAWGDAIAPPLFPLSTGFPEAVSLTPHEEEVMGRGDPLRGVGQYLRAERWLFGAPLRAGMRLMKRKALIDATLNDQRDHGRGLRAITTVRIVYTDSATGEVVAVTEREYSHADRPDDHAAAPTSSGSAGTQWEPTVYSDEELAEIDAAYESEVRRGPEPRLAADVSPGDSLGRIVRGPFAVTDVIAHHIGQGFGDIFSIGPLRLGYLNRKRIPGFYTRTSQRYYDAAQRCHWDHEWANKLGYPAAYDYGMQRVNWMVNLVTNWAGDGAWIRSLEGQVRSFNYVGDTTWIEGSVAAVGSVDGVGAAQVEISGTNQRGQLSCRMTATVLLPGGAAGIGVPPAPSAAGRLDADSAGALRAGLGFGVQHA